VPDKFNPSGFTKDGDLYGTFQVNDTTTIATLDFQNLNSKSLPKSIIFLPFSPGSVKISPDGKRFAILANPNPPPTDTKLKTVIQPPQTSLYVVNTDGSNGAWWSPELKDVAQIAWNPNSSAIAVLSMTPKIGYHLVKSQIDICDGGATKHIADIANAATGVAWADGGNDLAFLCTNTSVLTPDHVYSVSVNGGTPVDRTPNLSGSATNISSDADGNVWVQISNGVIPEIDRYSNGALTKVFSSTGTPATCEIAGHPDYLVYSTGDEEHAPNLSAVKGTTLVPITHVGDADCAAIDFGPTQIIHWTSKEGIKLEGIATFPAGYDKNKKYPLLILPHGGPEMNDTYQLDSWSRIFAGLGYIVIQPQYRGSTGYGSAFLGAIYQHFGDRAYRDVDSATDYAIAQGWADPNRLAMFGWSAGGFMTSWTVTQTNRYKAAVEGAGITDWGSFIWTSDLEQIDYDARWPGKEPKFFHQFSAVDFADRVTTPILILHGAADRRVPTFQGQEFYEALVAQGKTARMVTYPGSGHFPSLWEQRRDVMQEAIAWLKKYNP